MNELEERWQSYWEERGIYRYDPARGRDETFVVDTPPPTVSGVLHIGHCYSFTQTDLVVRYHRMRGENIFYPMGWDDNGLATERRVQNMFNVRCDPSLPYEGEDLELERGADGQPRSLSRRKFIELCDAVVEEDERAFKSLFERLGLSCDWTQTYTTVGRRSRFVSQLSFLHLLEKGEAELRDAPTMWDIDFQSAIAQAEVEDRDKEGSFYNIRFGLESGGSVVIATTRPELIPACIALVAHPDDERYRSLIGTNAITPLFEAPVPIVADEGAEMEKGTGILMVCTFGDAADVEWWRELAVPVREIIGRDGRIKPVPWGEAQWVSNDPATAAEHHAKLSGLTINQAQREIVAALEMAGAIEGEPEKLRRPVKFYEKGERPLEFVVTRQWFVKILDKKQVLLEQGRKVAWHPLVMQKRYEDWVEGLNQDWCVSRQRYFGVPIPVWYGVGADGAIDYTNVIVPRKEDLPVDPSAETPTGFRPEQRGEPGGFVGDPDVFDTWGTSSLTPLIVSGWPDDEQRHRALYPNDLRPQAHDIIRTWAFYTITRAYLEDGSVPWKHAAISGFILDPDRKKMSKSKGNVVVPTETLDQFGSDAVRYWAASGRLGWDSAWDPKVLKDGRRLATKLLNAARLVYGYEGDAGEVTYPLDRALIGRLRATIARVTDRWDAWEHQNALGITETWFWSDLCDNYLELSKGRAYRSDPSAIATLRIAMDVVLRLFAPIVPFITEEIWQTTAAKADSIHVASWPTVGELPAGEDEGCFDAAVAVLTQVRRAKSQAKVSMRFPVRHLGVTGPESKLGLLKLVMDDVTETGNIADYELIADGAAETLVADTQLAEPEPA
ncbi:MAG TPA: valine--tRNA ligase [Actinomycetota bacterium]|nr:valine--tRNA ligase [Actinomycetota bacterium]